MPDSIAAVRNQQTLLAKAWCHRNEWTSADLEYVRRTRSYPAAAIAAILGRSLYAVRNARLHV